MGCQGIPKIGIPKIGIPKTGIPKVEKTHTGTLPETEISKARDSEARDSEDRGSESRDSEAGDSENEQMHCPLNSDTPRLPLNSSRIEGTRIGDKWLPHFRSIIQLSVPARCSREFHSHLESPNLLKKGG